jgi:hypothetical protein
MDKRKTYNFLSFFIFYLFFSSFPINALDTDSSDSQVHFPGKVNLLNVLRIRDNYYFESGISLGFHYLLPEQEAGWLTGRVHFGFEMELNSIIVTFFFLDSVFSTDDEEDSGLHVNWSDVTASFSSSVYIGYTIDPLDYFSAGCITTFTSTYSEDPHGAYTGLGAFLYVKLFFDVRFDYYFFQFSNQEWWGDNWRLSIGYSAYLDEIP